jgi:F-type H+-transporting ATPase subunit c
VNKKTIMMAALPMLVSVSAFAQDAVATAPAGSGVRWNLVSACFLLAIAAAAGAIGQARGVAAACEGIARNPSAAGAIRLAMIIGLALIESLVIYALIIAYLVMKS